jgi:hypothetical protein
LYQIFKLNLKTIFIMKKFYILLVAIMVTSLSFGQELLVNGDLEAWDDATTPTGWTKAEALDQESTDVHGGTYAAKRDGTVNSGTKDLAQSIAITGGDNYTVTLWYKVISGDDTDARIWASWKDAAGDYLPTDQQSAELKGPNNSYLPSNTGVWTEYTATVNAPADAAELNFEVRAYGSSVVIWDDLSFMHNAVPQPGLSINTPVEGDVFAAGNDVMVNFDVTNFDVGAADGTHDGHIHYTIDGAMTMVYDTNDITLSGLAAGNHILYMELVDDGHVAIDPAVNVTVNFEVTAFTQVATIADLRASAIDGYYELTGEAFINMAIDYRNQKWIQDATAGVLIYDFDGNITAGVRGEGISSVKGQLVDYNGLLEFKPMEDATITTTPSFTPTAQIVTIAEILANGDDYEAELVKVQNVTLADYDDGGAGTADGTFQNGKNYPMTQGADVLAFRTNFYNVDYITTALPSTPKDIVGLIGQYNDFQFTARDLADFSDVAAISENTIEGFNMYPNPVKEVLNITTLQNTTKNVQIFNVLGKQVLAKTISGTSINVSNLNAGIYIVKVEETGNTVTRKLVIK